MRFFKVDCETNYTHDGINLILKKLKKALFILNITFHIYEILSMSSLNLTGSGIE